MLGREDGIYQHYLKTAIHRLSLLHSSHTRARIGTVDQTTCDDNLSLISSGIFPFFSCKEPFQLCETMKEAGNPVFLAISEHWQGSGGFLFLEIVLYTVLSTIQWNSGAPSFSVKCPFPSFSNPCEVQLFLHSPLEWLDQWDMLTWREELLYSLVKDQECAMNRERVPWIPVISLTLAFILNEPSC